jgi:pSer/pThr/pTyr-binding forkhead associated (FHA) protein
VSDATPWALLALRVVMAAALIAIVAIAARYAWRDYLQQSRSRATASLRLDLALDRGARAYRVDAEAWIGRDPNCLICLPDTVISARHARLFWSAGAWRIEDAGSRNGTRVNGQTLAQAAELSAGDVIEIGSARLTVSASA